MSPIKLQPFILPKLLRLGLIVGIIAMAGVYAIWQARFLILGPEVMVFNDPATVQNERVITLQGRAENVTALYLNGRPISIDQAGDFAEGVILENGYTVVSIDATDRYGRNIHWEKSFVYTEGSKRPDVAQR